MKTVAGLHHVTAIAGPAQENLDFYSGGLGLRLVKKSVNQDDTGTYHLFYADDEGHPGTDLTFFPWHGAAPARPGHGLASEVSLAVPPGSLAWWRTRLERAGTAIGFTSTRFGEAVLPLTDPHGLRVALVESEPARNRPFSPWKSGPVPAEFQIRGLHGARIVERDVAATTAFLADTMGFRHLAAEGAWQRFEVGEGGSGAHVDVAEEPGASRGIWGVGSIHHLAWRVEDEAHQQAVRERVQAAARRPTPVIDRFWFKSVYFTEPGGVVFELATDGPGFAVDEDPAQLGESLVLPPWLEPRRREIEAALPPLAAPATLRAER